MAASICLDLGRAVAKDAHRLQVERPRHAVDDEAGRVGGHDRRLAQPARRRNGGRRATVGAVAGPAITSTSAMSGTGLKKCIPTTRSGRVAAAAIAPPTGCSCWSPGSSSGSAAASSRRNASRLSSRSSGIASTTRSAAASSSNDGAGREPVEGRRRAGGVQLALLHLARQEAGRSAPRALVGAGDRVVDDDLDARLGGDLGDARAHRAGAQDPDALDGLGRRLSAQGSAAPASRRMPRSPSAWSSVRPASSWSAASMARLSARSASSAWLMARLARPMPRVGAAASAARPPRAPWRPADPPARRR